MSVRFLVRRSVACIGICWFATAAASASDAGVALELPQAQALALAHQPLLQAQQRRVDAGRERAVAARQLPDPQLKVFVQNLPVNQADAWRLDADFMTMQGVGVMQELPLASKRRLRGEIQGLGAAMAEQDLAATTLEVRRDAALAWLEVWKPERAAAFARRTADQAELQAQAVEIAYRNAKATQGDVLAARTEAQLLRDDVAELEQQAAQARNALSRWIGDDARRVLSPDLPAWAPPPDADTLLARLRSHPLLNSAAKQIEMAQTEVKLARQSYRPDWRVGMEYAYRRHFSEMVSVDIGVDLPIFPGKRQDRELAATLADQDRAEQLREDLWRQQAAAARQSLSNWQRLQERLARYEQDILPQSTQRVEAARLAWQSGQGVLIAVLDARRVDLENHIKQLELQKEAAMNRLDLQFLLGETP